jgi:hypothetical protein
VERKTLAILALNILVFLVAMPASAHHSMTGYDRSHTTTLRATIADFNWINPHVEIYFEVNQGSGTVVKWLAEMPGPGRPERNGWSNDTLKSGDQVTIVGNPARDGTLSMRLLKVVLPDGREMTAYGY